MILLLNPGQTEGFAEIGLLGYWLRVSQGVSLEDFLAPGYP